MNGASTANGAMVTTRNRTTLPRACSTEVLKKIVPARETMTKASPAPAAAVSSMSVDSPVRPAPDAPVTRCTRPPVLRVPLLTAPVVARAAPPVRRSASDIHMYPVFLVATGTANQLHRNRRVTALSPYAMSENW